MTKHKARVRRDARTVERIGDFGVDFCVSVSFHFTVFTQECDQSCFESTEPLQNANMASVTKSNVGASV